MANTFLYAVANFVLTQSDTSNIVVVFPNRRAGGFLQKKLNDLANRPLWMPDIKSMDDFALQSTGFVLADEVVLIHKLFQVYHKYLPTNQTFEDFFGWGQVLLNDFGEFDKYLIDTKMLFTIVAQHKELEVWLSAVGNDDANQPVLEFIAGLSVEQREALKTFAIHFLNQTHQSVEYFLRTWAALPNVFADFKQKVLYDEIPAVYNGLLYNKARQAVVANKIYDNNGLFYVFAGFDFLSPCEQDIVVHFLENKQGTIFWDVDAFYLDATQRPLHEAARHLRKYMLHPVLKNTFSSQVPNRISQKPADAITLLKTTSPAGQVHAMAFAINQVPATEWEDTLVVVPDKNLLFPVLHAMPQQLKNINVSSGFPFKGTALFELISTVIKLIQSAKGTAEKPLFYHKNVKHILSMPFVAALHIAAVSKLKSIIALQNKIWVPQALFTDLPPQVAYLFKKPDTTTALLAYFRELLQVLADFYVTKPNATEGVERSSNHIERDFLAAVADGLNRIEAYQTNQNIEVTQDLFFTFFKQQISGLSLAFSGDPIKGLQVMGLLETRALEFKNVIVLGLAEGTFPKDTPLRSFVPYNLRKGVGLPLPEGHQSLQAWYFYRLLHGAEKVYLISSATDTKGDAVQPSRYLYQLKYDSHFNINELALQFSQIPEATQPISVSKNNQIIGQMLAKFGTDKTEASEQKRKQGLSPSAIISYINCPLQFYLSQVAEITEPPEAQEGINPLLVGSVLHLAMEFLYEDYVQKKEKILITESFLQAAKQRIDAALDKAYRKYFELEEDAQPDWNGHNALVKSIVTKYVNLIIDADLAYAPFVLEGTEASKDFDDQIKVKTPEGDIKVALKGIIDRIDLKDNTRRVVDYKTGGDDLSISSIENLFTPEGLKKGKGIFQILYYGRLARIKEPAPRIYIAPAIYALRQLSASSKTTSITIGGQPVNDIDIVLNDFNTNLKQTLSQMFDNTIPFMQTTNTDVCQYCAYKDFCKR